MAHLPDHRMVRAWERVKCNLNLYDQAVGYWEIHPWCLSMMWAVLSRTPFRIDMAVTTRGPGFAQAVAKRVENENWPVHYVFSDPPEQLGRRLASMPDVKRVYYGVESQRFAYGPQAHFIGPSIGLSVA